ncbi:MAG: hypothetical protein KKF98_16230 [Bacteroidetes bacterium]|nr:hypothetical protein [Bacteroidota bacterium]
MNYLNLKLLINTLALIFLFSISGCDQKRSKQEKLLNNPSKVELVKTPDQYQLLVNGEPFYIKGAGLEFGNMESLAKHGGNAIRTWRVNNGIQTGREVLDEAHKHGLMVSMGLDVAKERHGFNYDDEKAVAEQFERIKQEVISLKDHPALLIWGIGNELNLHYKNPKVWYAVNQIAQMIHDVDPNHPVTTMLAGADKEVIEQVTTLCPDLDFLSFQLYGDIVNLPKYLIESNYQGPYIVTEWGATGHWEVAQTSWGRPIEQTSSEKAMAYRERYELVIASDPQRCLGSFVFLWGQKQERTPTWYGLFLKSGEETPTVDVMHYLWNNKWPLNQSPVLHSLVLNGKNAYENIMLTPGKEYITKAVVSDPENDKITYAWAILTEVAHDKASDGGDFEQHPDTMLEHNYGVHGNELTFVTPEPGEYRLFVYASDGNGHAATANIPFLVEDYVLD